MRSNLIKCSPGLCRAAREVSAIQARSPSLPDLRPEAGVFSSESARERAARPNVLILRLIFSVGRNVDKTRQRMAAHSGESAGPTRSGKLVVFRSCGLGITRKNMIYRLPSSGLIQILWALHFPRFIVTSSSFLTFDTSILNRSGLAFSYTHFS